MKKQSATSAAEMEALLVHAVVQTKARTGEAKAETRAAQELGVQLMGIVRTMPALRTWRVRSEAGGPAGLVTLADAATAAEREHFARTAQDVEAAGDSLRGVLPVRRLTRGHDAFVTDLWTTGTARDLSALGWPMRRRIEFALGIARALATLHQLGLSHGCLCADNVLLDDDLNPVLSEAGLVSVPELLKRKDAGLYEPFAAPEVREGGEADARSDVYSTGKLLQAMLEGDADLPQAIKELTDRCLMPAPLRFADAKELAAALQGALEAIPTEPVRPAAPTETRPAPRREHDAAPQATGIPGKEEPSGPWKPPVALGLVGIACVVASFVGAAFAGGSNDLLRALATWGLPVGAALASTLAPPLRSSPALGRLALAGGLVGLVLAFNPLTIAFHMAAQAHLHGDDVTRRKAVDEILRMDRDFRGLSLAGLNLAGLDMTGADLRRVNLSGADLAGSKLFAAEVDGASFDGAQLAGADLQQTALELATVGAARCDGGTALPASFVCTGGRIERNRTPPAP